MAISNQRYVFLGWKISQVFEHIKSVQVPDTCFLTHDLAGRMLRDYVLELGNVIPSKGEQEVVNV